MYETDTLASQYCEFHYGDSYFEVENFPKAIATLASKYTTNNNRALDIGCAVGRATFELAKNFDSVDGLDYSQNFIDIANRIKEKEYIKFMNITEGDLHSHKTVKLADLDLCPSNKNTNFHQQDAMNMDSSFTNYDLVIAVNLIDRLHTPTQFLEDIKSRINKDGILLIASPYTWLEEFTPKENWLGGYRKDGVDVGTLDGLKENLDDTFELLEEPQKVPFVIKETIHKYQHTLSEVTIWKKR